jgi:hypothetical protein
MYTSLGNYPIIPAADLLDLQSAANRPGNGNSRVGSVPYILGKVASQFAWRDAGSSAYSLVFATGALSSSKWRLCDGSADYTPVNISTWTVGADSSYSSSLLTTDAGNDAAGRASQSMTLTAGTYVIRGTSTAEGTLANHAAPRIRVGTSVTNGDLLTKILRDAYHATAAESGTHAEFATEFVVATTGTIYITLDVVDEDGVFVAGSAYVSLSPLESK